MLLALGNSVNGQPLNNQDDSLLPDDFSINFGLIESHGTIMLIIDPQTGVILKANKAARRFYGYYSLVGMNINQINTLSPDKVAKEMQLALDQNRNYFNFKHRTASDAIKSVRVYSYPWEFQGKEFLFSIIHDVSMEDKKNLFVFNVFLVIISTFLIIVIFFLMKTISERNKVEENIKAIQNSLEYAQEIGQIGSWEYDAINRRTTWSKNFFKMLGFKYGMIIPTHSLFLQSIHPEDLKLYKASEEEAKRTRKPQNTELRYFSAKEETRWCRIYIAPFFLEDSLSLLKSVIIDITDIKVYETKLLYQFGYMDYALHISKNFINLTSDDFVGSIRVNLLGICNTFDMDRVGFVKFNSQLDTMFFEESVSRIEKANNTDRIIGSPMEDYPELQRRSLQGNYFLVKDLDNMPEAAKIEREILLSRGTKSFLGVPVVYEREVLGYLSLESLSQKNAFDNDKIISLQLIAELFASVLIRRRIHLNLINAMEDSIKANQAKTLFISNISHETRTPLNGVIGFTDLLLDTQLDSTQKEYMKNVNVSARTLLEIISNLLDLSKIESGKFELEKGIIDLHQVMEEAISIIQFSIKSKGLTSKLTIAPDTPRIVIMDSNRIKQVIVNLLNNAVKFTYKGEVSLSLTFKNIQDNIGEFQFQIKDTGIGISPEHLNQIQMYIAKDDGSIAKRQGGAGLGLIISSSILKFCGSNLKFESVLGEGSIFHFALELEYFSELDIEKIGKKIENQSNTPSEYTSTGLASLRPRILIVEDVDLNMTLVKKILLKVIPKVILLEAIDGKQAIDIFKQEEVDLVLMDVQMPILNGLEATEWIRSLEKGNPYKTNVPIIALTAGATKEELNIVLQSGMNDSITKPIIMEELINILEKYLLTTRA